MSPVMSFYARRNPEDSRYLNRFVFFFKNVGDFFGNLLFAAKMTFIVFTFFIRCKIF